MQQNTTPTPKPDEAGSTRQQGGEHLVIDMTPTWAEWAHIYAMLAESGERKACRALRADLERMAKLADLAVAAHRT